MKNFKKIVAILAASSKNYIWKHCSIYNNSLWNNNVVTQRVLMTKEFAATEF
jgi:hypothetical protein